jgi:ABC-type lipoprotein export system ATPase subunit
VAFDGVAYPKVSSTHARIEPAANGGGFVLVHESRSNRTLLNGQPVDGSATVGLGDVVRLGFTGPSLEILAIEPDGWTTAPTSPAPPPTADFSLTTQADAIDVALLRGSARSQRLEIGSAGGVIGRNASQADFVLDHPHVSRRHATLSIESGQVVLTDLNSANGTFVNGQPIDAPTSLAPGGRVDIGPFGLRFDGEALVGRSRANEAELAARGVGRVVTNRATGQPLAILDGVDLVIRPGEFACILGPSGSGKTTLLAALSGRARPSSGSVLLNGDDLHVYFESLKENIAVVPQKDILHDALTVAEALRYTAELRLPPDTTAEEREANLADILAIVGLESRRDTPIRHLSGGQVKRASLANELIARPGLLFLDEVTSGLDEQADREVMELFRRVADGGRTVVCITHSLAAVAVVATLVGLHRIGRRAP